MELTKKEKKSIANSKYYQKNLFLKGLVNGTERKKSKEK